MTRWAWFLMTLFVGVLCAVTLERSAADDKSYDEIILQSLRKSNVKGSELCAKSGDFKGACSVFGNTLDRVRSLTKDRPATQRLIETTLEKASREKDDATRALLLHDTLKSLIVQFRGVAKAEESDALVLTNQDGIQLKFLAKANPAPEQPKKPEETSGEKEKIAEDAERLRKEAEVLKQENERLKKELEALKTRQKPETIKEDPELNAAELRRIEQQKAALTRDIQSKKKDLDVLQDKRTDLESEKFNRMLKVAGGTLKVAGAADSDGELLATFFLGAVVGSAVADDSNRKITDADKKIYVKACEIASLEYQLDRLTARPKLLSQGKAYPRVEDVSPGGNGDKIGLRAGDLLLAYNGHDLDECSYYQLRKWILDSDKGFATATLEVKYLRNGEVRRGEIPAGKLLGVVLNCPGDYDSTAVIYARNAPNDNVDVTIEVNGVPFPWPKGEQALVLRLPPGKHHVVLQSQAGNARFHRDFGLVEVRDRSDRWIFFDAQVNPGAYFRPR